MFQDFVRLTPYRYRPFVRSFESFAEYERWRRAQKNLGTDNRVLRVCRLLNRYRVRYLLAGAVAANLHGSVRATRDVDILVPPDARNMGRLLRALLHLPWGVARELDAAEMATKPITIIGDDPRVDVLTVA